MNGWSIFIGLVLIAFLAFLFRPRNKGNQAVRSRRRGTNYRKLQIQIFRIQKLIKGKLLFFQVNKLFLKQRKCMIQMTF